MKKHYFFLMFFIGAIVLLSSCAKYDYHSTVEVTNEDELDANFAEPSLV